MPSPSLIDQFLGDHFVPRVSPNSPPPNSEWIERFFSADASELGSAEQRADLARSLMLLQAGDLDRAHTIVQSAAEKEAAYIHGMIHRVEGDFSNARYWFHRAGPHPGEPTIDPIDLTDQVAKEKLPADLLRREVVGMLRHLGAM
jgi:hypothetical protein